MLWSQVIAHERMKRKSFSLLLKFHTFHQINKTRFVSQIVPFRFDFEKSHFWVALFVGLFQPFKRVVAHLQGIVNQRDVIRRNVSRG